MSSHAKQTPKRSPVRLAGWAPALFAIGALGARLVFTFFLGLFWVHYKRQAIVLVVQAALCAGLVALARRGVFRKLTQGARWACLGAVAAGCAGWILFACYGLEPADLVFETAWAAALGVLVLAALWPRAPWPQLALSVATCAMLVVAAEWMLGLRARCEARRPLADYGDVCNRYPEHPLGEAGTSRAGVNVLVRGPYGPQRWVTNRAGFRSEREFTREPAPGVLRVLAVGDSFTVGYRTSQDRFWGAVLERALNDALTTATGGRYRKAEVLVAGSETAIMAASYLQRSGLGWKPHVVVHGICLGNDMAQAYLMTLPGSYFDAGQTTAGLAIRERREGTPGLRGAEAAMALLPREAFRPGLVPVERMLDRLQTRYGLSRLGSVVQTIPGLDFTPIAVSFEGDGKYRLHQFDLSHGLAFCLKAPPRLIEDAYASEARSLAALKAVCAPEGCRVIAALFPQRYAVSESEWQRTVRRFALAPECFDTGLPARRVAAACERAGLGCLDLTGALRAAGDCYLPLGDMHWNERGHEAVGRALAARILQEIGRN